MNLINGMGFIGFRVARTVGWLVQVPIGWIEQGCLFQRVDALGMSIDGDRFSV